MKKIKRIICFLLIIPFIFVLSACKKDNNPSGGGNTDRYPRDVLQFKWDTQKSKLHPTQKPVELCEYFIKTYTDKGDIVLDNCMGSGTTGVACYNLERNFIGIEKEEKYFSVALDRIKKNISPWDRNTELKIF